MSTTFAPRYEANEYIGETAEGKPLHALRNDLHLAYKLDEGFKVLWWECIDCPWLREHRVMTTVYRADTATEFMDHLLDHVCRDRLVVLRHHLEHVASSAIAENYSE